MNQTAVITGASKRIGKSVVQHLAAKGWSVVIHYNRSGNEAQALVDDLQLKYPQQRFWAFAADLSNPEEVQALIPEIIAQVGAFDLLVNNASVFKGGSIQSTSEALFDSQINVNLKAPFLLMRDFARHCGKGNIINFVDTRITQNKSDYSAYTLAKKSLWKATKMAALEFAPQIRVNAIAPGVTLAPADQGAAYLQELAQNIPMKKPGGVEPVLKSIDYILENDHLTGQLLFADGGENL